MNNRHASSSPPLIADTRELLQATGLPWVIENVTGALAHMNATITLTGAQFGLEVHRPSCLRPASCSWPRHRQGVRRTAPPSTASGIAQEYPWTRKDGTELRVSDLETGSEAMGIDWMTWNELEQAIPPAYTEYVGTQLMANLKVKS